MGRTKRTSHGKLKPGSRGKINGTEFEVGSGNIFADLGLENAGELAAKSELVGRINQMIETAGWDQATAAKNLGTHQPVISALKNGRMESVTYDRLMSWLLMLGLGVEIKVVRSRRPRVRVTAAR
jgi:predicted XRE-type DNA-binding protein